MNSQMQHLQRPFSSSEIRERQGRKNMMYKYVPSRIVVDRLNEIEDSNWNFIIKNWEKVGNEVIVTCSMTIFGITKESFGSCELDEYKSFGESLKTAQSQALTKIAYYFGIPCVFNEVSSGFSQPQSQPRQTVGGSRQGADRSSHQHQQGNKKGCMDCGQVITAAEANFTRNQPQKFQGKELCRACQKNYQHIQRVQ